MGSDDGDVDTYDDLTGDDELKQDNGGGEHEPAPVNTLHEELPSSIGIESVVSGPSAALS
jgi:hypothetical protein